MTTRKGIDDSRWAVVSPGRSGAMGVFFVAFYQKDIVVLSSREALDIV
jgi:hypothetical protein